jgi:type VI secretion system secreted protein Hcp
VTIEGMKQGKFIGESTSKPHAGKIPALGFWYEVKSPRNVATGQASGKRQHFPVVITKEWGPASPMLFQALVSNELLKSVVFEFVQLSAQGIEDVYHQITLTNAAVSHIRQYLDKPVGAFPLEDIAFTFANIAIENKVGKTTAADSWSGLGQYELPVYRG